MIENNGSSGRHAGNGPATESRHRMPLLPSERTLCEGVPNESNRRMLGKRAVAAVTIDAGPQEGAATEETVMVGNGLYLPGWVEGNKVSFLVDMGSGVSILAARTWRKWSRSESELTRYWGRLCSVEGRALECLGRTRLTGSAVRGRGLPSRPLQSRGRAHGTAPALHHPGGHRGVGYHGGNPCGSGLGTADAGTTYRHASTHCRSNPKGGRRSDDSGWTRTNGAVSSAGSGRSGPGQQDLASQHGATASQKRRERGSSNGTVRHGGAKNEPRGRPSPGDKVSGLVERAAPHLTDEECQQSRMSMAAPRHLFAREIWVGLT